jgi:hypothetical protein
MIYFPKSRFQISHEVALAAGAAVAAEGQALVASTIAGVFGAAPSAGSSGELFLGVAISAQITLASFPKVETFVIGAGLTYTLSRTPSGSTLTVLNGATAVAAGAGATQYQLSGATLTFGGTGVAAAGQTIVAVYRFVPTVVEAVSIQGDITPGGTAAAQLGQVGVVKSGVIYTSEYDTAVNWMATNPIITTGANGRFTIGGSGATVNGVVVAAPNASGPQGAFLGIEFSAQ